MDEIGSSTTQQDKSLMDVSVDSNSTRPSLLKNSGELNERQCKRTRGLDEDSEIQAVLKTLARSKTFLSRSVIRSWTR